MDDDQPAYPTDYPCLVCRRWTSLEIPLTMVEGATETVLCPKCQAVHLVDMVDRGDGVLIPHTALLVP